MKVIALDEAKIIKMLEDLSFNILIQYKNKDLAELEKIKYTAKSLKQGVISKDLADLLIDRANEMYEVDKKRFYWHTYVEGYNNSEMIYVPVNSMNKEVRELLVKFSLTKEEFSKLKNLLENPLNSDEKIEKEIEKNTIFPENFNKKKIEIRVEGNTIKTTSEYDPALIEIIKKLNYSWNSSKKSWEREINKFRGPLVDRIVELATKLLSKGYAVKAPEDFLESIKKGEFTAEQTRWITWNEIKNMFSISFENNEKIKNALNSIKHSCQNYKYYVKVEYYEEILEFSEIFNFSISELAQENIEKYKEFEDKKIKVTTKKSSKIDKNLEDIINQGYDVLDDLKD